MPWEVRAARLDTCVKYIFFYNSRSTIPLSVALRKLHAQLTQPERQNTPHDAPKYPKSEVLIKVIIIQILVEVNAAAARLHPRLDHRDELHLESEHCGRRYARWVALSSVGVLWGAGECR